MQQAVKRTVNKVQIVRAFSTSASKSVDIVVLPGDGIGEEITQESIKVLNSLNTDTKFNFTSHHIGGIAIDECNDPLPDETLEACKKAKGILLGAVGGPKWDDPNAELRPEQGLLKIRKSLDLYANLRPIVFFKELLDSSPIKPEIIKGVDMLFVRELTGGIYFGERQEDTDDVAWDKMIYSKAEVERIVRVAAEAARKRGGNLTSVDKANVLASSRLWRKTAEATIANEYPDVKLSHGLVDSCAMDIITNPKKFDVVVTENMFGDILTDEASVLSGSLGLLPSASLSSEGKPGIFEPIHGSAPDIAGTGKANPIASILSAAMMLRYSLDNNKDAQVIEDAVAAVIRDGYRTADLMREDHPNKQTLVSTTEMGDLIASYTQKLSNASASAGAGATGARAFSTTTRATPSSNPAAAQRRGFSTSAHGIHRPVVAKRGFSSEAASKPRTMFDKIWDNHVVDAKEDGATLIYIDRHLVHEVTSPQAFEGLPLSLAMSPCLFKCPLYI